MIPGYSKKTVSEFKQDLERAIHFASLKRKKELKAKRKKEELSYEMISELTGFSTSTLQRWRKKIVKIPPEQDIEYFCEKLGINPLIFAKFDRITEEETIRIDNAARGDEIGLKDWFLQYLHDDPKLHDLVGGIIISSSEGYGSYTFRNPAYPFDKVLFAEGKVDHEPAEELYPDKAAAMVLRIIQSKTEQLIRNCITTYESALSNTIMEDLEKEVTRLVEAELPGMY